jgi:hypothetical protein
VVITVTRAVITAAVPVVTGGSEGVARAVFGLTGSFAVTSPARQVAPGSNGVRAEANAVTAETVPVAAETIPVTAEMISGVTETVGAPRKPRQER